MRRSVSLLAALLLAGCAYTPEVVPPGAGTAPPPSPPPSSNSEPPVAPVADFTPEGCPVEEPAFCEQAPNLANALVAGDSEAVFDLSRPDRFDCEGLDTEIFPQCEDRNALAGYALGTHQGEIYYLRENAYRNTLEFFVEAVDDATDRVRSVVDRACSTRTWQAESEDRPSRRGSGCYAAEGGTVGVVRHRGGDRLKRVRSRSCRPPRRRADRTGRTARTPPRPRRKSLARGVVGSERCSRSPSCRVLSSVSGREGLTLRVEPAQAAAGGRIADLYVRHSPSGLRLTYLLTGDRLLAEDLMQEAFARLIGHLRHLRDPDAFDAYLRRTIVNLSTRPLPASTVERAYLEREAPRVLRESREPDLVTHEAMLAGEVRPDGAGRVPGRDRGLRDRVGDGRVVARGQRSQRLGRREPRSNIAETGRTRVS